MSDPLREQYATGANLGARIDFHRRFSTAPVRWNEWLIQRMTIAPEARIVELGCGTGLFWRSQLERVSPEWRLVLTDFSAGMLGEARRITSALPCRVSFVAADAQAIPLEDAAVDVVVAKHMLYHVPDRDRAFSEIGRVLATHGVFYATTTRGTYLQRIDEVVARSVPGAPSICAVVGSQFGEANGAEQLQRWFSHVDVEIFEDELRVTDPSAVVDYIRSTGTWSGIDSAAFEAIATDVAREIEHDGAFIADGGAVLFTCRA